MGMALWVAGILALALKINADEAKKHPSFDVPPHTVSAPDTTKRDTTVITGTTKDSIR